MKRILSMLAVLVILAAAAMPLSVQAADNPVPKAKQAVVRVAAGIYFNNRGELKTFDSRGYYGSGTAFGVSGGDSGAQVFATNCHVVADDSGKAYDFVYICIDGADIYEESTLVKCQVLYADPEIDVAIIQAAAPIGGVGTLPLLPAREMETGADVFALGFPGIADEVADENKYTAEDITVTDGIISRYLTTDGVNCMAHTATVNHGNSGGPLINEFGHAIGINTFIYADQSTADLRCYAIYIDYVMEVLDSLGIAYDQVSLSNPAPGTSARPEETEGSAQQPEDKTGEEPVSLPVGKVLLLAAGGAACVAVLAVAVLLVRKKTAAKTRGNAAQTALYSLYAVSGPLQGQSWNLTTALTIGRDPHGSIVYPADTKGISRSHCRLDLRNDEVLITDLGSSFGTYVGGRKLSPNTPVRIGPHAEIMLGSEKVKMILRR